MTKDEALQLALEALRFALHVGFDESSETQIKKRDKAWQQHHQAINAIKEALETKEGLLDRKSYLLGLYDQKSRLGLETKDEPKCVAIIEVFEKDWRLDYMSLPVGKHKLYAQQYTYTTTPQSETKDEPVGSLSVRYYRGAKSMTNTDFDYYGDLPEGDFELYTTPQRKPLTREDIDRLHEEDCFSGNIYEITAEIEAAHGIKENT